MKALHFLYGGLIASSILSFAPLTSAQIISVVLITLVLIVAYALKRKDRDDSSFLHNHTTYLIRTVWISGLFLTIGIIAAILLMVGLADNTIIEELFVQAQSGQTFDDSQIQSVMDAYLSQNYGLFLKTSLPCLLTPMIYLAYRIVKGYGRAIKGYRLANPESWL